MKNLISLLFLTLIICSANAQSIKKPLTHDDILKWNRITETHLSNNGKVIIYKEEPWKGDAVLQIYTSNGDQKISFTGGTNAKITADSRWVVFEQKPLEDSIRSLKLKKTKKEDFPKNKLLIYEVKTGKTDTIESLKTFKVPKKWAGWIAWQTEATKDSTKKGKASKTNDKGFPLFIKNLNSGETREISNVNTYIFAEEQAVIAYSTEAKDSTDTPAVYVSNLDSGNELQIDSDGNYKQLIINKEGNMVAFLKDSTKRKKEDNKYDLYVYKGEDLAEQIVTNQNEAFPEKWAISDHGALSFSENGKRLFFGTAPVKIPEDTTVLKEEIPVLDVWHWKEERLQTVQIKNKDRDSKKTYLAVAHLNDGQIVQLENRKFTGIRKIKDGDSDKLVAWSNRPYAVQTMWEGSPYHNDFYLIDIKTGKAEMIKKDCRATPRVSPGGKYLYWYNAMDTTWNTYDISNNKEYKVTTADLIQIADELNDRPMPPGSYSIGGWLENDEAFFVYDRFDIWKVDPQNIIAPKNITKEGRQNKISFRVINFDPAQSGSGYSRRTTSTKGINPEKPLYLKAHNEATRADSYYKLELKRGKEIQKLYSGNYRLNTPKKAKDSDILVFTKEDFETYPDLLLSDLGFKKEKQISNAAPQQKEFLWGTAELVSWTSLDGRILEGTLHKPENFDPNKKYPMIVNFYEKSSQGLLSYRMPEIGRSTIGYHYYTSNGYVVFNPDVYYKTGYPGEDAFNCVMPGVTAMIAKGFIDEKRIGAQGHSWGGYQVAYLATRTNLFAAIESGAPVVNMFSAYGGIRWGSGLNRSFQYEHTQSRIGKTIWESPLRYIENSPVFTLDKINTPILIMHNDDDGAVPWYQGIEFFIGLRRLQKPAWLLNYNEADHWPLKLRDKIDFQKRMAQFFDHYLKGKAMPKWMDEGIPATQKGIELGYDLID